jgi:integrase
VSRGHIRQRGKNSFELKYDIVSADGQRQTRYKSIKGTRRDAQAELTRLLATVDDGSHVDANKLTVAVHVRARLAQWQAMGVIGAKTAERYAGLIEQQIIPHLGGKLIQRLTTLDIETWHGTLLSNGRTDGGGGLSAQTINHAHDVLSKALRDAVLHSLLAKNVCTLQRPPRVPQREIQILSPQQVADLPAQVHGHEHAHPILLALFTGMREGEILGLHWGNVDLDHKIVKVRVSLEETKSGLRFKAPKSKAGRRDISLPMIVVESLREHRRQLLERRLLLGQGKLTATDLVFPAWDGSPQRPNSFSSTFAKMAKTIGLGITFHALRHTHASQLIDSNIDVVTISKRLGHANPAITLKVYAHLFRNDDSKAAAAIDAVMGK